MAKEDSSFEMELCGEFVEIVTPNWEFYFEVGKHQKPKLGAPNLDFVVHEKIDEIWLLVNDSLIHFGLGEFAIMTRLKCNGVAHKNCNSREKNNLIDRCFAGIKKINVQTIADFFF
ncbi:hypothetical protein R3W88_024051 [Solanum pinnatisectum]|uniref:DUF1985 domain-containing protein n=1 Tax=Solanum pinnatisectum TaxID=50273 RepID=A0AAV9LZ76_9SOLN|nr:hypothetical protein R3W88_024051 [Solanum pinnatisectum]